MRETKFRGVSKITGLFLYGDLLHLNGQAVIIPFGSIGNIDVEKLLVYPDTVCEYSGQKDGTKWEDMSTGEQEIWSMSKYVKEDGTLCFYTTENWAGRDIYDGDSVICWTHHSQAHYNISWNSHCSIFDFVEEGIDREDECEINYYLKENMQHYMCMVDGNIFGIKDKVC